MVLATSDLRTCQSRERGCVRRVPIARIRVDLVTRSVRIYGEAYLYTRYQEEEILTAGEIPRSDRCVIPEKGSDVQVPKVQQMRTSGTILTLLERQTMNFKVL